MSYEDNAGNVMTYDDLDAIPALSEIRAGLWQGRRPDTGGYESFDVVVNCEQWVRRRPLATFKGLFMHIPFADEDDENAVPWGSIESAAEAVAHALSGGARVYVHCTAGLNRSSLVVHQTLRGLGYTAQDAVDLIREKRSKWALCNKTFERLCLEH